MPTVTPKLDEVATYAGFATRGTVNTAVTCSAARGVRVPTNQAAGDPTIYGIWAGTYQRFDAGRQLKPDVNCYAY